MSTEAFTEEETAALAEMKGVSESDVPAQPEPQPERQPEPVAEKPVEAPAPEPVKPPEGYVPHGAMHEERKRRQAAEAQLQELRARLEAVEKAKEAPPEPQWVDPVTDPEGHRRWEEQRLAAVTEQQQRLAQQIEAQQRQQQMASYVMRSEADFAARTPDYQSALDHLRTSRERELTYLGYDDDARRQIIANDLRAITAEAMQRQLNVAEVIYGFAQSRGYAKPADPAPVKVEAEKVDALARAQAQTATIGAAAGGSAPVTYTLEMLAKMSEADLAKLPADVKRRVLGG